MVGVDVEVEHQVELLRLLGADRLLLLAAAREAGGEGRGRYGQCDLGGCPHPSTRSSQATARRAASGDCQLTTRRSSRVSRPNRAIAITDNTNVAANTRAVNSWALALKIRWPSPSLAPTHSPKTAPITATATATFAP